MKKMNSDEKTVIAVSVILVILVAAGIIFTIVKLLSRNDSTFITDTDPSAEAGSITSG